MELKPTEAVAWWSALFGLAGFVSTQYLAKKLKEEVKLPDILIGLGIVLAASIFAANLVARSKGI